VDGKTKLVVADPLPKNIKTDSILFQNIQRKVSKFHYNVDIEKELLDEYDTNELEVIQPEEKQDTMEASGDVDSKEYCAEKAVEIHKRMLVMAEAYRQISIIMEHNI
jgi:hypothetical protein